MTFDLGTPVRTLTDLLADDGSIVPIGTPGHVVGYQGERLVVSFPDGEGETLTATANAWELLRQPQPRLVR